MPLLEAPTGATYGWRGRIGFIQPGAVAENNPFEFYLMAPPGVTLVMTALGHSGPLNQAAFDLMLANIDEAVERLLVRKIDAIVVAGVPHIASKGWGYEDVIRQQVAKLTPLPLVTDLGLCIDAMTALGLRKVAVLTPFDDPMHRLLSDYVGHAGITVAGAKSIRPSEELYEEISFVPLANVYRAAKAVFQAAPGADGVWITGALMPTVGVIAALEQDLGVPVVTSMQAMAWGGLRAVGVRDTVTGYGRLMTMA
ncbi:MAG: hypothetical protein EXR51_02495 [Dehalococcoidia bacterium]|nr:hypothetical protein [Dehalococcoidia bacterium]